MKRILYLLLGPAFYFLSYLSGPLWGLEPAVSKVVGVCGWMIIWWVTEALPIPATALLPVILFPFFGISTIAETTSYYGHNLIFLFMGGFFIAIALEKWNLHTRLALVILLRTGTGLNGIIAGFMISTAFLSMWISNTACTLMMLPIALSVLNILHEDENQEQKGFKSALMMTIAYSANIGGFATLIGTPPNVVMTGLMKQMHYATPDFAYWMLFGVPASGLILWGSYLLLTKVMFKFSTRSSEIIKHSLEVRLKSLGKMNRNEMIVISIFLLASALWIFKDAIKLMTEIPWLDDTWIAIGCAMLFFLIPAKNSESTVLLNWEDVSKLPWGILLLFGGGLNMAAAMEKCGLVQQIANTVAAGETLTPFVLLFILVIVSVFLTEIMSNLALVTIMVPVVAAVAIGYGIEPIFLVAPVTVAASCGFMMPFGTPPNAIVYGSGYIAFKTMVKTGFWLNLISVIVVSILSYWLLPLIM
jgi:sodium-dependent dicarboxylate transporter 2/3/5